MLLNNLLTTFVVFGQLGLLAPLALLLDSPLGSPTVDPAKWRPAGGSSKEGAFSLSPCALSSRQLQFLKQPTPLPPSWALDRHALAPLTAHGGELVATALGVPLQLRQHLVCCLHSSTQLSRLPLGLPIILWQLLGLRWPTLLVWCIPCGLVWRRPHRALLFPPYGLSLPGSFHPGSPPCWSLRWWQASWR